MYDPLTFRTDNNNFYLYDNSTRCVLPIDEEIYLSLRNNNSLDRSKSIEKMQNDYRRYHLFAQLDMKKEQETLTDNAKQYIISNGLKHIILMITEQCNFRCKYCIYSDAYSYSRNHSFLSMSWETAKQAIDYFIQFNLKSLEYNPNLFPSVGFYGGEALTNWEIIVKSVEYIKQKYSKEFPNIIYTITTNGSLLDSNKINFMLDNKFSIAVSIDGNKEDHDRNRIYANGSKSFDDVYKNIELLDRIYQEKAKNNKDIYRYSLIMSYDNLTSFEETINESLKHKNIYEKFSRINRIREMGTEYYKNQPPKSKISGKIKEILKSYADGILELDSKIIKLLFSQNVLVPKMNIQFNNNTLRGTCIPGEKLAVGVDGTFYMCERIDYQSSIGNIKDGIDWNKQKKYLTKFLKLREEKCTDCNVSNICNQCFSCCSNGDGNFFLNQDMCKNFKNSIESIFSLYYTAKENRIEIL